MREKFDDVWLVGLDAIDSGRRNCVEALSATNRCGESLHVGVCSSALVLGRDVAGRFDIWSACCLLTLAASIHLTWASAGSVGKVGKPHQAHQTSDCKLE